MVDKFPFRLYYIDYRDCLQWRTVENNRDIQYLIAIEKKVLQPGIDRFNIIFEDE